MATPVSQLQELSNKAILEFYSMELKADVHYTKDAKTATYSQSSTTITITLNSHGFSTGLIFKKNMAMAHMFLRFLTMVIFLFRGQS